MPKDTPLVGARILVAEDNPIQALDLKLLLQSAGAEVIGPAKTGAEVLALAKTPNLTCAVLDVLLRHEYVFPAARVLQDRAVAIIFHTGTFLDSIRRDWPEAQVVAKLPLLAYCSMPFVPLASLPAKGSGHKAESRSL